VISINGMSRLSSGQAKSGASIQSCRADAQADFRPSLRREPRSSPAFRWIEKPEFRRSSEWRCRGLCDIRGAASAEAAWGLSLKNSAQTCRPYHAS